MFEATLDYLGLGVQPPTASWGNILAGASSVLQAPGGSWSSRPLDRLITTLAFNLLGDGVRDAMDPRTERIFAAAARKAASAGAPPRAPTPATDPPRQPAPRLRI